MDQKMRENNWKEETEEEPEIPSINIPISWVTPGTMRKCGTNSSQEEKEK